MNPKEMFSDNSSQRYTILNFAKVSVRHRGIAQLNIIFTSHEAWKLGLRKKPFPGTVNPLILPG